ncbi:DUF1217 domain-containing protein [Parvularcula sp. LCG005]|uniref:DUF1217 domain-containing protein n=1 Tax=Parvularcula sp. LCG005 TaxID=3078805 RepID=UPI00294252FD|nr:DUF1217 domain-containing protein [Parvularcula sp. LCG005]WOI52273.1 DUF1217 domain-containing protein [Parvularcula sp. LCG005]
MTTSLAAFTLFQKTAAPIRIDVAARTDDTAIQAEVDYWRDNIGAIKNVDAFVEDSRLFRFAKTAFGFAANENPDSVLALALEGGSTSASSFANRSVDYRIEDMVRNFAFAEFKTTKLSDPAFVESVVRRYINKSAAADAPTSTIPTRTDTQATYFLQNIGRVESAADLVNDIGLYNFTMTAFGLKDRARDTALIQGVLDGGTGDATDLANTLQDPALYDLAAAFGFDNGTDRIQDPRFANSVVERFKRAEGLTTSTASADESKASAEFRSMISKVGSVDDLVDNFKLYNYVMTAFDLGGETNKTGLVRKVLNDGVLDQDALANKLSDPRYADMARTLGIEEFGLRNLRDPAVIDMIVQRFERVSRENEAGEENGAVEIAAYFQRKAPTINSWLEVAADTRLLNMALTALDLPAAIGALDLDRMIKTLEDRMDIADLQDPAKLENFVNRYLINSDTGGATSAGYSDTSMALSILTASNATTSGNLYSLVGSL